ncbi:hypothetical protein C8F01DRAFT_1263271 [Mycena amicta]|nr:hypothetical protein C8F01DRAFT_1263271 [Mycena amicta]
MAQPAYLYLYECEVPVPSPPPPPPAQSARPSHITLAEYQCRETEVKFTACEVREGSRPVYKHIFHDNFDSCPDVCPHCLHGFIQDLDEVGFVYGVLIDCPHFVPDDYANPPLQPNGAVAEFLRTREHTCRTPRGGLIVFKQDRRGRQHTNPWAYPLVSLTAAEQDRVAHCVLAWLETLTLDPRGDAYFVPAKGQAAAAPADSPTVV